jgi:hypothetical protein
MGRNKAVRVRAVALSFPLPTSPLSSNCTSLIRQGRHLHSTDLTNVSPSFHDTILLTQRPTRLKWHGAASLRTTVTMYAQPLISVRKNKSVEQIS